MSLLKSALGLLIALTLSTTEVIGQDFDEIDDRIIVRSYVATTDRGAAIAVGFHAGGRWVILVHGRIVPARALVVGLMEDLERARFESGRQGFEQDAVLLVDLADGALLGVLVEQAATGQGEGAEPAMPAGTNLFDLLFSSGDERQFGNLPGCRSAQELVPKKTLRRRTAIEAGSAESIV